MKVFAVFFTSLLMVGILACNKKKANNLLPAAPPAATCPAGSVLLPNGTVLPQGACPVGQGEHPNGSCEAGTTCQAANNGIIPNARYFDTLQVIHEGDFKQLLNDVNTLPYNCLRDVKGMSVWGESDCKHHVGRVEILIESVNSNPIGFNTLSSAQVTVLAGYVPLWFTINMGYYNINNNQGFELRSGFSQFRVNVETGHLGDDSFLVKLYYGTTAEPFAQGWVSQKP